MMKENTQPPIEMLMQKAIEQIPDNPLNNEKLMKLKLKIYIYIYILMMIMLMILDFFHPYLVKIEKILK